MINNLTLVGRLTRDPELRRTNNGTSIANFTLAVDDVVGAKMEKTTSFIDVTAWSAIAENVCKYSKKGDTIGVVGALKQERFETPNGNRSILKVIARSIIFFTKSDKHVEKNNTPDYSIPTNSQQNYPINQELASFDSDDLPF